jgi:hypothetical protein
MSLSNHLETALINAVLRNTSYSSPAKVYLALFTADPGEAGSGTEVSGGSYARQEIAFTAPTDGVAPNSNQVVFPVATGSWGIVTHFGVMDALTSGNLLFYGAMTTSRTIATGNTIVVPIANVTCSLA